MSAISKTQQTSETEQHDTDRTLFASNGQIYTPSAQPDFDQIEEDANSLRQPGTLIGNHYRLEKRMGIGGMSEVWKAIDIIREEGNLRDPYVAIKFLSADFKPHPDALKVFVREFNRYERVVHPNIVRAYKLDRTENETFIVMAFLDGILLTELIKKNPHGLQIKKAKSIIKDMAAALAHAHHEGIAHLDFTPNNIFYDPKTEKIKVIDFGVAQPIKTSEREQTNYTFKGLAALTKPYASYEILMALTPDARADIYSLACISYELLSGKHPYKGNAANEAQQKNLHPAPIKKLNRKQNKVLLNALAIKRNERIDSVENFFNGLFPSPNPVKKCLVISVGIMILLLLLI